MTPQLDTGGNKEQSHVLTRLLFTLAEMAASSYLHHSLMKVATCYQNIENQSSILPSVNESLVMSVPSHSGLIIAVSTVCSIINRNNRSALFD